MTEKKLEEMTQDELLEYQNKLETDYRIGQQHLSLVEEQDIILSKKILNLQNERKDNQIVLGKAKFNVRRISSELREVKNRYWQSRNG